MKKNFLIIFNSFKKSSKFSIVYNLYLINFNKNYFFYKFYDFYFYKNFFLLNLFYKSFFINYSLKPSFDGHKIFIKLNKAHFSINNLLILEFFKTNIFEDSIPHFKNYYNVLNNFNKYSYKNFIQYLNLKMNCCFKVKNKFFTILVFKEDNFFNIFEKISYDSNNGINILTTWRFFYISFLNSSNFKSVLYFNVLNSKIKFKLPFKSKKFSKINYFISIEYFFKFNLKYFYLNNFYYVIKKNNLKNKLKNYRFLKKVYKSHLFKAFLELNPNFFNLKLYNYVYNKNNLVNFKNLDLHNYNFLKVYNNYYPLVNDLKINDFYTFFKKDFMYNAFSFNIFNMNFLEFFFKNKFFIKIKKPDFKNVKLNFLINHITEMFSKRKFYFLDNKVIPQMIMILIFSFFKKDLTFFFSWFLINLQAINLYNHKIFLSFFKNVIMVGLFMYFPTLKIRGFFFDIRGKVGVAGNSKKRHFSFLAGSLKLSTKSVKLDYKNDIVKTTTGCLGITMLLAYD